LYCDLQIATAYRGGDLGIWLFYMMPMMNRYGGRKTKRDDKDKDKDDYDYDKKRGGKKRRSSRKKGTKKMQKRMKKYMW